MLRISIYRIGSGKWAVSRHMNAVKLVIGDPFCLLEIWMCFELVDRRRVTRAVDQSLELRRREICYTNVTGFAGLYKLGHGSPCLDKVLLQAIV